MAASNIVMEQFFFQIKRGDNCWGERVQVYVVLGVRKVLELDESEKISLKFSDSFLQTWVRRNSVPNKSE